MPIHSAASISNYTYLSATTLGRFQIHRPPPDSKYFFDLSSVLYPLIQRTEEQESTVSGVTRTTRHIKSCSASGFLSEDNGTALDDTQTSEDHQQGRRYPGEILFYDGRKISIEEVKRPRQIERDLVDEAWPPEEIMLRDNILRNHGRTPYEDERDTLI